MGKLFSRASDHEAIHTRRFLESLPPEEEFGVAKKPPPRRRRNFFGRLGRGLRDSMTGELRDERAPNPLDFILFGSNGIADMQQMNMLAAQSARQAAEAEATRRQGKQRNATIEQAIANEPPEVQALARAFPEVYARRVLRPQDNGWESGQGYSHAFRVNPDGTVTRGDPLPLRPRAAIQGYVMPSDADEWEYEE